LWGTTKTERKKKREYPFVQESGRDGGLDWSKEERGNGKWATGMEKEKGQEERGEGRGEREWPKGKGV
jgi:hypothetical protein